MAENDEQDRAETENQAATLSDDEAFEQGYAALTAASESDEADQAEDDSDASDSAETTDEDSDNPTPPTAKELGVDTTTAEGKEQFKRLLAKWNKWQSRHQAKQQKYEEQPKEEEKPAPAAQTPSGEFDPYAVDFDSFKPDLKFREGSDLADYKDELIELMADANKQAIQHALSSIRRNDATYREMEQVGTAQQQIAKFAAELQAHPDWEEKAADVAEFAQNTRDLAVKNPEKWIRAVEGLTGISRDWRQTTQRAQPQRPQKKPIANVSRPTNGNRASFAPSGTNDMELGDAFEMNWRKHGLG